MFSQDEGRWRKKPEDVFEPEVLVSTYGTNSGSRYLYSDIYDVYLSSR